MPQPSAALWRLFARQRCSALPRTRVLTVPIPSNRHHTTSPTKIVAPPTIELRQYQEECIQAVLSHIHQGHKRLGVSLATGAGKTVVFTQLIDRVKAPSVKATQTLIIAHRQELVEQAANHCRRAYPSKSIDIEMGSIHASGHADITIASVQSIISGDRLAKFDPKKFKLVLVDEAHHVVAPGYLKTLAHFGLAAPRVIGDVGATMDVDFRASIEAPTLVGVSATLSRFDGLKLGAAIDEIVYHKDYIDMIEEKWLSDVIFTTVDSRADISRVKAGPTGDFQSGELSRAVNTEQTNDITVRSWLAKAKERKSTLVFCIDVAHIEDLTSTFRSHGINAQYVTGETSKAERSARLDAFRAGSFQVLLNCGVFTEGTDVPNIDCVLLARPTKSRNLLIQMIGRGMRLHAGKINCHVIDMVASLATGIVTTPTLFGLDPSEVLDQVTPQDMKQREESSAMLSQIEAEGRAEPASTNTKVTFTDYDSVYDLIGDSTSENHVRSISQYAWVMVDDGKYILTSTTGKYLKLEETTNAQEPYTVHEIVPVDSFNRSKSASPSRRPRLIAAALTFGDAVHAADTYAARNYVHRLISRKENWRMSPATEGQLAFLNKLRPQEDQLTPDMLTKGRAGDMITKMKHGARGRFAKVEAMNRKKEKVRQKDEAALSLRRREKVSVGPVAL